MEEGGGARWIEEKLQFSILVLNIHELPILGKAGYIYDSLLYKGDCVKGDRQMWLLFDDGHFSVITDIKAFLCVREFCSRCLRCFNDCHKDKERLGVLISLAVNYCPSLYGGVPLCVPMRPCITVRPNACVPKVLQTKH